LCYQFPGTALKIQNQKFLHQNLKRPPHVICYLQNITPSSSDVIQLACKSAFLCYLCSTNSRHWAPSTITHIGTTYETRRPCFQGSIKVAPVWFLTSVTKCIIYGVYEVTVLFRKV